MQLQLNALQFTPNKCVGSRKGKLLLVACVGTAASLLSNCGGNARFAQGNDVVTTGVMLSEFLHIFNFV